MLNLPNKEKLSLRLCLQSNDHPNVDELYNRVSKIDSKN